MVSHGYLLPTRGVTMASDDPGELATRVQADVVGLARRAESAGFESLWVGDRVVDYHRPEALTTLATVAGATESATLGTAVYLPTLRHPVHVAHRTATLDQLSGGRLALGVGAGAPDVEYEHERLGIPFEDRGTRLNESLDAVRALWSGDRVDYEGEVYDLSDVGIGFSPVRTPTVYIATGSYHSEKGFPRPVANRIATHGDGWLPLGISASDYADGLARIRDLFLETGRDPDRLDAAVYQDVVVDETEEAAIERAREFLLSYYGSRHQELPEDRIREQGVFGPPECVAEHLDRYADAGVETFVTRFPARNQREQLSRFVEIME